MGPDISYLYEKMIVTVHHLATGKERIKERLKAVCFEPFHGLDRFFPDDLVDEKSKYERIDAELKRDGTYSETIDEMTEDEAADIARRILDLASKIEAQYHAQYG